MKGEADCWQGIKTKQDFYEKDKTESFPAICDQVLFSHLREGKNDYPEKLATEKVKLGTFPGGPVAERICLPMQGTQV